MTSFSRTIRCGEVYLRGITALLLDKDGTLADSHPYLRSLALARAQRIEQQVPGSATSLLAAFGCSETHYNPAGLMAVGTRYDNEVAAAAYIAATGRPWSDALKIAQTAFVESDRAVVRKADHTPPFSGILDCLQRWHICGLKLAVLSGDTTANVEDFVNCYGLADIVTWCAGSERPPIKPDPQMLWSACQALGVTPEESLVIGDSELDAQLAYRGNARGFISVTWGGSPQIAGAIATLTHPDQLQVLPELTQSNNTLR